MPFNEIRSREIRRETCLRDFAGRDSIQSGWFDATTLEANSEGRYEIPIGSFLTYSTKNPTKIKVFENSGTNANAKQTITPTGKIEGGTFTLEYNKEVTEAIKFNATGEEVANALIKLASIASSSNIAVSVGEEKKVNEKATVIEFKGLLGDKAQPLIVINQEKITGAEEPKLSIATTTAGTTAEKIIGVFDGPERDFFGNTISADEAIPIYFHACSFDISKLPQWNKYGILAKEALANCNFY